MIYSGCLLLVASYWLWIVSSSYSGNYIFDLNSGFSFEFWLFGLNKYVSTINCIIFHQNNDVKSFFNGF